jgi:hypothetical protein
VPSASASASMRHGFGKQYQNPADRIDFIGLDLEKHPPMENAVKIVKWSGTFTATLKLQ